MIVEFLKIVVGLAIISALVYYLITQGLPPRGKGRWRDVLKEIGDDKRR